MARPVLRRQCQLRKHRPDIVIKDLRGNVNTRLAKLDDKQYDAIILAAAGLIRLGMEQRIRHEIDAKTCLPAVGQGAVGIECRNDDAELISLLAPLNDGHTATRVSAERAMNETLQGGCQVPIGSYAELQGNSLTLRGLVGSPDGQNIVYAQMTGTPDQAEEIGRTVANKLLEQGAKGLLDALHE